ncbi:hypothetical protein ACE2AJ_18735 [Aquihabitans daechungensis]|uniref:hypothetical protein n=1 Tax=Aquihabitans daechungensis TaxID=1052257 RepID=UPI003BA2A90F
MQQVEIRFGEIRPIRSPAVEVRLDVFADGKPLGTTIASVHRKTMVNADGPVAYALAQVAVGDFVVDPSRLRRAIASGEHRVDPGFVRQELLHKLRPLERGDSIYGPAPLDLP